MPKNVVPVLGIAGITLAAILGTAPDPVRGRDLFLAHCATCHGAWAEGDGPALSALGIAAPDLTEIATRRDGRFPYDEIRGIIEGRRASDAHHPRVMPAWGEEFTLAAGGGIRGQEDAWEKIEALMAYLESVQTDLETD